MTFDHGLSMLAQVFMSSPPIKPEVGQTIGDYEVLELLGRGGMGKVFKVRNTISHRIEAMKVLLAEVEATPEIAERFMREIRLVASLDHPNIAELRTALRVGDQMLMIMEYVEGSSLERILQSRRIDVALGVRYITQVLCALSYAHQHGVVHRDVKPSNILVRNDGGIKLTDFGIASRAGDPRLTAAGTALGSLYYMSPEQVNAAPLDARSDIYSAGVTLYEVVTGRRPIQGDSLFSVIKAHLEQRPLPPIELAPHISAEFSALIQRSLEKAPENRFQTADQFRAALRRIYPETPPAATEPAAAYTTTPVSGLAFRQGFESGSSGSFDPALLEILRKSLAAYIGPMAKVIVHRAAKIAPSRQALYETLAAEIPSPKDRQAFLKSLPL